MIHKKNSQKEFTKMIHKKNSQKEFTKNDSKQWPGVLVQTNRSDWYGSWSLCHLGQRHHQQGCQEQQSSGHKQQQSYDQWSGIIDYWLLCIFILSCWHG